MVIWKAQIDSAYDTEIASTSLSFVGSSPGWPTDARQANATESVVAGPSCRRSTRRVAGPETQDASDFSRNPSAFEAWRTGPHHGRIPKFEEVEHLAPCFRWILYIFGFSGPDNPYYIHHESQLYSGIGENSPVIHNHECIKGDKIRNRNCLTLPLLISRKATEPHEGVSPGPRHHTCTSIIPSQPLSTFIGRLS